MKLVDLSVRQPITIAVAVILVLLAGFVALDRMPIRMTPEVQSVVISVTTYWENASPEQIESDVIEEQEQRLGDVSGLESMTSVSKAGQGQIRLEFSTGTDIDQAMAEVVQKLDEVPVYPDGVNKPEIEDVDPESVDYIAWVGLASTDPSFDPSQLYEFLERRLRPRFERIPGISQVGIVGAQEREVQIRVDPSALARRGITWSELVDALRVNNEDWSGGSVQVGKNDIRVRAIGRFSDPKEVEGMVVRRESGGPIYLGDVAEIVETLKEPTSWVRARGHRMPFLNFQLALGSNLLRTSALMKAEIDELNAPGGLLEQEARRLGLDGTLELVQTYDSTKYVEDALDLVQSNILFGGVLAILTLLLFLRSPRTIGVIAMAIPISVIGAIVLLVAMGRSMNIISLAGMAFAVGMVVDNAIVVIENVFRHIEMGKGKREAALVGTQEVAGAVTASTLTTLVVFLPIILIEEQAGQLFRDIALAIMASVGLSLVVSLTVIPAAAALILRPGKVRERARKREEAATGHRRSHGPMRVVRSLLDLPGHVARLVAFINARWITRILTVVVFGTATVIGILLLVPPADYLPAGNRNIVFGLLMTPPGYGLDKIDQIGDRVEDRIRPFWQAAGDRFGIEPRARGTERPPEVELPEVPIGPGEPGTVVPPPLEHYFLVALEGQMFQVAIASEDAKERAADAVSLLSWAAGPDLVPDVIAFAVQFPLINTGGRTGSAIKVDLVGDDLGSVAASAGALMGELIGTFGPYAITPDPASFSLPRPELRVLPDDERLRDLGMTRRDVGYAVAANGDGLLLVRSFQLGSELKDMKVISKAALGDEPVADLVQAPLSTPDGRIVDLPSVATIERIASPDAIKHVDRQRAVTLQLTPPPGMPLTSAIEAVNAAVAKLRDAQVIPQTVEVQLAGSADELERIQTALMGADVPGFFTSSIFLSLLVVYLLMVVLFQSWLQPMVIMVSVPLATVGGFAALRLVHDWSVADRYVPVQNMDVLTLLGFVILAGVVVNNAILIVHQALNFMAGREGEPMPALRAITASVHSRVRPILMSSLTSVGGMLPLVLLPGAGSELYRGLGAVVVGGLLVSTVFTLILVPALLAIVLELGERRAQRAAASGSGVSAS